MEVIKSETPITFETARQMERAGELKKAAAIYEKLIPQTGKKIKVLERFMVVYRKLSEPIKEIKTIDAAVKIHEQFYPVKQSKDKRMAGLSAQLNKSLGHTNKKGKNMLNPPEINKLQLRKERLLKSLSKKPSEKK